ncbi:MAG TPA: RNA polymerase sigma factor [Gemmatimonadaceae bacterium]|jgi:RNA polymerase sigma-70 factor (ECF subfamily)
MVEAPLSDTFALQHPAHATALDSRTLIRAKLGDIDAFTQIVDAYHARCLRFACAMLRHSDDAEDVVQDAFVRLYRALPRYEERQRFEPWLFQILGNCCRSANTVYSRERSRSSDDDFALDRLVSTDDAGRRAEMGWSDAVRRALADVPEHNREIFLLHHIEEFSYEEIERMTGVKQSALKMRVKRAAEALRTRLVAYQEQL